MTNNNNDLFKPTPELLARIAEIGASSRRVWDKCLARRCSEIEFSIPDPAVLGRVFTELVQHLLANPLLLAQAQAAFKRDMDELLHRTQQRFEGQTVQPLVQNRHKDRRFNDHIWHDNVLFDFIRQAYLLAYSSILDTVQQIPGLPDATLKKADFYSRQMLDALAPTNNPWTNPQVLRATLNSQGNNLLKGFEYFLADLQCSQGGLQIRRTDTRAFILGETIAATPGKVIYQNRLMQLLQYQPTTETVYRRPLLIVPPWINKFYVLDLRPENSFIKWAVAQGFTVFVLSWVNPDASLAEVDFEDYLRDGPLAALDAIQAATAEPTVNAIGYCLGGTLLACTLAYLAAKRQSKRIASATLLATLLDFSDAGELAVFIDDEQIRLVEHHMAQQGYLRGVEMANVFNMLRANDLIWSFYVRNYLLGRSPPAFDLLYWNGDTTRMPHAMHSFYLRQMYLHNRLCEPSGITLAGRAIDLGRINTPVYFLSAREDHIAPWRSTYAGTRLMAGRVMFVLAESGHIAGVINPPGASRYGYWINSILDGEAKDWLVKADYHSGSWWWHWLRWLKRRAGWPVAARHPGSGQLTVIEDAPGSYVRVRDD